MGNWKEDPEERFVNPYNFVPFEKAIRRPIEGLNPGDLTGVITCEMTLLTPLFIPNTSNSHALHEVKEDKGVNKDKEGNSYDFFSYQDLSGKDYIDILKYPCEPVIPGSEIRGAVRSVYEVVFQGCASQVDLKRRLGSNSQARLKQKELKRCRKKDVPQLTIENLLKSETCDVFPCSQDNFICSACVLFGMVAKGGESGRALGSRVRFGDAERINKENQNCSSCYAPPNTLPELGEPKPSATEFYTFMTDGGPTGSYKYWTYDYKMKDKMPILFQQNNPEQWPQLRGRKFYWHSDAWKTYIKDQAKPDTMRQKIRTLKKTNINPDNRRSFEDNKYSFEGNRFSFKIYFENITLLELQQLCWALDFNDKNCAHKIGRAKPLGFGSVKIEIKNIKKREISLETGQQIMIDLPMHTWQKEFIPPRSDAVLALKQIANWEDRLINANICYPKVEAKKHGLNQKASHQWFKGNREMDNPQTFHKVLPKIEEEIILEEPKSEEENTLNEKWLYKLKKINK